jgi:hypothetical protein
MSTQLKIDSVIWDFGDETTSTDLDYQKYRRLYSHVNKNSKRGNQRPY